jgi:hypothetical protein
MKGIASVLLLLALVATGCARHRATEPSASPGMNDNRASCEAAGGKWNPLTRNCKVADK